jgi:hypothetical protein
LTAQARRIVVSHGLVDVQIVGVYVLQTISLDAAIHVMAARTSVQRSL